MSKVESSELTCDAIVCSPCVNHVNSRLKAFGKHSRREPSPASDGKVRRACGNQTEKAKAKRQLKTAPTMKGLRPSLSQRKSLSRKLQNLPPIIQAAKVAQLESDKFVSVHSRIAANAKGKCTLVPLCPEF